MLQSNFFPSLKDVNFIKCAKIYEAFLLKKYPGGENERQKYLKKITLGINNNEKVLISNEHFSMPSSWLNPDVEKYNSREEISILLKEYFPNAKILLIIRNQVDWIESWYQERVKRNEWRRIDELINSNFFETEIVSYLDFNLTIEHYQKIFGIKNVKIVPMEILKEDQQKFSDLITNFFEIKKIKSTSLPKIKNSQSSFLTEIKRRLNFFFFFFALNRDTKYSRIFFRFYKTFSSLFAFTSKCIRPTKLKKIDDNIILSFKKKNKLFAKKNLINLKKYKYY